MQRLDSLNKVEHINQVTNVNSEVYDVPKNLVSLAQYVVSSFLHEWLSPTSKTSGSGFICFLVYGFLVISDRYRSYVCCHIVLPPIVNQQFETNSRVTLHVAFVRCTDLIRVRGCS